MGSYTITVTMAVEQMGQDRKRMRCGAGGRVTDWQSSDMVS